MKISGKVVYRLCSPFCSVTSCTKWRLLHYCTFAISENKLAINWSTIVYSGCSCTEDNVCCNLIFQGNWKNLAVIDSLIYNLLQLCISCCQNTSFSCDNRTCMSRQILPLCKDTDYLHPRIPLQSRGHDWLTTTLLCKVCLNHRYKLCGLNLLLFVSPCHLWFRMWKS